MTPAVKVFISYSWKPEHFKEKALELANRLRSEGVDVVFDRFDLKEGHNKYHFMEQMVNDPDVFRVLVLCTKEYALKANNKNGGVGVESTIISPEVYSQVSQEKFIPVIFEKDENGQPYLPVFLKSNIYIDLSDPETYENGHDELLRNIYQKRAIVKPPLGTMPAYLRDEVKSFLPTAGRVQAMRRALEEDRRNAIIFVQGYMDSFIQGLEDFKVPEVEYDKNKVDERVELAIASFKPLRDDYVWFLESYCDLSVEMDMERIHAFLEGIINFISNNDTIYSQRSLRSISYDHFKFLAHELFMYTTALLLRKKRFSELSVLVHQPYIVNDGIRFSSYSYSIFRFYLASINEIKNIKLNQPRQDNTIRLIQQRSDGKYKFDDLKEADCLLYYLGYFNGESRERWYPYTASTGLYSILNFEMLISRRYFNKFLPLFNCTTEDHFKEKLKEISETERNDSVRYQVRLSRIQELINVKTLASIP